MADLFHDDLVLHMATMMLVAFKLVQFVDWSWWIVCLPSIIAILLYLFSYFASD